MPGDLRFHRFNHDGQFKEGFPSKDGPHREPARQAGSVGQGQIKRGHKDIYGMLISLTKNGWRLKINDAKTGKDLGKMYYDWDPATQTMTKVAQKSKELYEFNHYWRKEKKTKQNH